MLPDAALQHSYELEGNLHETPLYVDGLCRLASEGRRHLVASVVFEGALCPEMSYSVPVSTLCPPTAGWTRASFRTKNEPRCVPRHRPAAFLILCRHLHETPLYVQGLHTLASHKGSLWVPRCFLRALSALKSHTPHPCPPCVHPRLGGHGPISQQT